MLKFLRHMQKIEKYLAQSKKMTVDILEEHLDLYEIATSYEDESFIADIDINYLFEMSRLLSFRTGLPFDIWVDEGDRNRHGKRIKFPKTKSDKDSRNWVPMTISKNPEIPDSALKKLKPGEIKLTSKEIELLKRFIVLNLEPLNKLGTRYRTKQGKEAVYDLGWLCGKDEKGKDVITPV